MNYTRGRNLFRALFVVSALGLIAYAAYLLAGGSWGAEPPVEPTKGMFGFYAVFLLLGAVLLPILSAVGWVTTVLLKKRQEREGMD